MGRRFSIGSRQQAYSFAIFIISALIASGSAQCPLGQTPQYTVGVQPQTCVDGLYGCQPGYECTGSYIITGIKICCGPATGAASSLPLYSYYGSPYYTNSLAVVGNSGGAINGGYGGLCPGGQRPLSGYCTVNAVVGNTGACPFGYACTPTAVGSTVGLCCGSGFGNSAAVVGYNSASLPSQCPLGQVAELIGGQVRHCIGGGSGCTRGYTCTSTIAGVRGLCCGSPGIYGHTTRCPGGRTPAYTSAGQMQTCLTSYSATCPAGYQCADVGSRLGLCCSYPTWGYGK